MMMRKIAASLVLLASSALLQAQVNGVFRSVNSATFYACQYPGADVGAKINAADTATLGIPADIVVQCSGTIMTVPTITSGHRLILAAPLTWGSVAPILSSNTQIIGSGNKAVQTVSVMAAWIISTSLTNLEIDNLWVTNTSVPTLEGSAILECISCTGVTMNHNHGFGIGVLFTRSTATTYAGVNSGNLTKGIHIEGNFVDGNEFGTAQSSRVITLAWLQFAQNVTAVGNDIINGEYNLEWWGGTAGAEGLVLTNPRWAQNISVVGGHATNVVTGWWGSMGSNITVAGVVVDGCIDTCLDAESSSYVNFTGFSVRNGGPGPSSGALAVFFSSQHNTFGPGTVVLDTTAFQPIFAHNASQNLALAANVTFHDINFVCNDPVNPCVMKFDAIGSLRFDDNTIINSDMSFTQTNNSDYEIARNNFTMPVSQANSVIVIPGQVNTISGSSRIEDNHFTVNAYPSGVYAIKATITDSNFSDQLFVGGNTTQGFTNDAQFIANSPNTSISPTFIFQNNVWGNNSVLKSITGNLGKFIGSEYNAATDSTVFSGPVGIGGLINGVGLQMISASACTPASNVMAQCTSTITLPVPQLNPGYVLVCNADGTNVFVGSTKNYTTTTFQVDIYAANTTSVSVSSISCLLTHP